MFFVNEEHECNFCQLLRKYPRAQSDSQYLSGIYIVAHPVIFDFCRQDPVVRGIGPYDWFFEKSSKPGLSGGFSLLCQAGLCIYNDYHEFSLYEALGNWGDELFNVFTQACMLVRCDPILFDEQFF
ncbi:hypothetical protein [Paenibacillus qinlingensis]|uniref:hypothetical protein n=1 Tax=Paenibacillus qinlingensis TaxID=1837343 RepID=UPI001564A3B5|nr:hypothetical protein [Paenibacillus qinlingensis]NQX62170.1 hypothetical protein [Paenibacillus qinlingensis]